MKTGLCASVIFSLPPPLCVSLQQTRKKGDAAVTESSETGFGVGPSAQGSAPASCRAELSDVPCADWQCPVNLSGRTGGMLALPEDGTVAVCGFARSNCLYFAFIS